MVCADDDAKEPATDIKNGVAAKPERALIRSARTKEREQGEKESGKAALVVGQIEWGRT